MLKIIKKLIKIISASVFIVGICAIAAVSYESYLYDYKGASVVKLTRTPMQFSGGTGFQIKAPSGKQYILTNAHICQIADSLYAKTQSGKISVVDVIKIYPHHDLCIMKPIVTGKIA